MRSEISTKRRDAAKRPKPAPEEQLPALFHVGVTCSWLAPTRGGIVVDAADYYRDVADAIESARAHVLISGWQLESSVWLRRRAEDEGRARTLRDVVRAAVDKNPDLRIFVLAWDWSSLYALDREWHTREKLIEAGRGRLHFRYDAVHPQAASQHEKLVIVDGHTAWVGGIDLCEHRWDERSHHSHNPLRFGSKGKLYGPYHDVTSVIRGPLVRPIADHFVDRWVRTGGEPIMLIPEPEPEEDPPCQISLGRSIVAAARTRGATVLPIQEPLREIRELMSRAIRGARELVYVESQYLTARAFVEALVARMRDRSRGPLETVVIVPERLDGAMEKVAIEAPQRTALIALREVARETGQPFGVFSPCVVSDDESGHCPTYVHTKLLMVDDAFLTVGSANATNRSMGLDSELNLAWHAQAPDDLVAHGIRTLRSTLLTEHAGVSDAAAVDLASARGIVSRLERLTQNPRSRLLRFEIGHHDLQRGPLDDVLVSLGDPERAELAEGIFEEIHERPRGLVARLMTALHDVGGAKV